MRQHVVRTWLLTLVVASALPLLACGHKQAAVLPPPAPPPAPPPVQVAPDRPAPPPPAPPVPEPPRPTPRPQPTASDLFNAKSLDTLNSERPLADVSFEYDRSELSDAARSLLQKDADWMRQWSTTKVVIEGHADSRGTNEYNLALGDRRAAAVRDYLVSLGITQARIAVVTKGEEQPVCSEETEECWAKNRRGHFIITEK